MSKPTKTTSKDREEWLGRALQCFETLALFPKRGLSLPPCRISCGWPRSSRGKRAGYAYPAELSADGSVEVFVSPEIAKPEHALAVTWSLAVSVAHGANASQRVVDAEAETLFGRAIPVDAEEAAAALATAPEFVEALALLGDYPHAAFAGNRKVAATRLLKLEHKCGWVARVSASQGAKVRSFSFCPACTEPEGWKLSDKPVA